jgi:hypothetical protein
MNIVPAAAISGSGRDVKAIGRCRISLKVTLKSHPNICRASAAQQNFPHIPEGRFATTGGYSVPPAAVKEHLNNIGTLKNVKAAFAKNYAV